jgi:pimeloyl-ACP methyl ester carboxylesterase
MKKNYGRKYLLSQLIIIIFGCLTIHAQEPTPTVTAPKGKMPVIIIPGLTGSELVNSKTGEVVWFKPQRAKDDDIRLPVSANLARNRDDLVAKDIIRSVQFFKFLPETEIYERLIEALEKRGGYHESNWKNPQKTDFEDAFYVFPYDWRRDNVENARLLVREIESLKRKLGKPNLKFNIIAHSMGGLIARYAAMYGNTELPAGNPRPTWAGARHLNKVFLLGTPNEGSVSSLNAILNGFSFVGGGLNLPFIQNISRFDVFTIPSIYQLLPHEGTFAAYDENLKPLAVDLYSLKTWEEYGWAIWQDEDFTKKLNAAEQKNARGYFQTVLERAKRFQAALDANSGDKIPVAIYLMGGDCKETANGVVLLRDTKKNRWKAQFKSDSFERADGTKVSAEEQKNLLFAMGDGVVTQRSLKGQTAGNKTVLPVVSELYQCESHNKLVTSPEVQDKLFALIFGTEGKIAEK